MVVKIKGYVFSFEEMLTPPALSHLMTPHHVQVSRPRGLFKDHLAPQEVTNDQAISVTQFMQLMNFIRKNICSFLLFLCWSQHEEIKIKVEHFGQFYGTLQRSDSPIGTNGRNWKRKWSASFIHILKFDVLLSTFHQVRRMDHLMVF